MRTLDGAALLTTEINRQKLTHAAAAKQLGVSPVTVHFWLKKTHRPSGSKRELIEAWSGGRVPREAWLSLSDRQELAAARKISKGAA